MRNRNNKNITIDYNAKNDISSKQFFMYTCYLKFAFLKLVKSSKKV